MELSNSFVVDAPIETTWNVLTDLERVAPCLPGASLTGIDGDDFHGRVRIKVGPVTAAYEGTARFAERDDGAHRGVIRAQARESRGQGGATATITAELAERGEGTQVCLRTDLALSGRVAQFGRGVISDVSAKLIGRFAERLEREITAGTGVGSAATTGPAATGSTTAPHIPGAGATGPPPGAASSSSDGPDEEGLDLLAVVGPLLRRAAPVLGTAVAALLTGIAVGRLGPRRATAGVATGAPAGTPVVLALVLPTATAKEHA